MFTCSIFIDGKHLLNVFIISNKNDACNLYTTLKAHVCFVFLIAFVKFLINFLIVFIMVINLIYEYMVHIY